MRGAPASPACIAGGTRRSFISFTHRVVRGAAARGRGPVSSSVGLAHSPFRRLPVCFPRLGSASDAGRAHTGTRRTGDPQRSGRAFPRGARMRDASAPCSRQIRSPSAHLFRCLARRPHAPPVGLEPIPPTEDRGCPSWPAFRRRALGLTTVHSYKDTKRPEPCRGGARRKRGFRGDSEDGEAMARRWRGDGEEMARGPGGDRSGQEGTAVGRHHLRPRGPDRPPAGRR